MKLACEIPINYIENCSQQTDFDFALAHLILEDPEYASYYLKLKSTSTRKLILDNGLFELGHALPSHKLFSAAELVQPDILIAPDVLGDAFETGQKFADFATEYQARNYNLGVVIQGKTLTEAIGCYKHFSSLSNVDCICFPFGARYAEFAFLEKDAQCLCSRLALITQLTKQGLVNLNKWHHLLGAGLPYELRLLSKFVWLNSVDTSIPFISVMKSVPVLESTEKLLRPGNYFTYPYDRDKVITFNDSIKYIKELVA